MPGAEGWEMRRHSGIGRRSVRAGLVVGLVATLGIAPVAAGKDAPATASCMGIERAAISPPGSSDEIPGGSSAFTAEVKEIAASLGWPPGALMSFVARLHEGSHEACDAALG
jgi:hypothetical protein